MSSRYDSFDENFPRLDKRYDDDDEMFYSSNAPVTSEMSKEQKDVCIGQQRLFEASTFDLMRELSRRFNHFIVVGKRYLSPEEGSTDRSDLRSVKMEIDDRMMAKGDVHTLSGMSQDAVIQMKYAMETGESYVDLGYGGELLADENEGDDDEPSV